MGDDHASEMIWTKTDICSRLPTNVFDVLLEIEKWAGLAISIAPNPRAPQPGDLFPDTPVLEFTESYATIWLRSVDSNPHGILHELLHLQRYWIDQVPMLTTRNAANKNITNDIDNNLEHLIVVPRESDYGFEPFGHWNSIEQRFWAKHPWPPGTSRWGIRQKCLMHWLSTSNLVTDEAVRICARSCLEKEDLLSEAEAFQRKMAAVVSDKSRMISAAVRFMKIPAADVHMQTMDVRNRRASVRQISAF